MNENFNLLPVEKSSNQKLNDVKTNLIKMLVNRNFINRENESDKIKKVIENSADEIIITLDNNANYNTIIESGEIKVKFFDYKITSTAKGSLISDFIIKNNKDYKILIVYDINNKSEKNLYSYDSLVEIFKFTELQINIVDHELVPVHFVLLPEEADLFLKEYNAMKKNMPLILTTDPIARYYNMKHGNICKIIRPSVSSGESFYYRLVVKKK
jgi:DNA-directed RNA polymerase subunit H (RpoH/RPB5)